MEYKHEAIGITAALCGDVIFSEFERDGETIPVANFTLVKKYGDGKEYTKCSVYGEKTEIAKDYRAGDMIHVFGYWKERQKGDKVYKNFIVLSHNKANGKENE